MTNSTLDVYFHEVLAGKLQQDTSGDLSFIYDVYYCRAGGSSLSVSLPTQIEPYKGILVKAFFSGFLPDDIVRHRLSRFLGISEKNAFRLLEQIGGECAGAVSLYPEGIMPTPEQAEDIEVLDDQKLREMLDLLKHRPLLAGTDDLRLSLAGAQDKLAVGMRDGKVALVKGTTPTSHILKPIISDVKDSVHNELFCMNLAKTMGIDVPHTEMRWSDDTPYFLIERYDRVHDENGHIRRLHQEDFCQALGIMPEHKYEREGGLGIKKCLALLQNYSVRPAVDSIAFLKRIIFNFLIGNADAHGKNFSLLYKNGAVALAPAYDLLCTAVYPHLSIKMAMKIDKSYEPNYVLLRHWQTLVPNTVAAKRSFDKQLLLMAHECVENAQQLKFHFENVGIKSSVFNDIFDVIKTRATHIQIMFDGA